MNEQSFHVGQEIECMDGNNQKWYNARIKKIESDRVLVGWCFPEWQDAKYDQWIVKAHYGIRIRPRNKNQEPRGPGGQIGHKFHVGQKVECMDGNNQKWYYARIKKVQPERVLVQWTEPKWQSAEYDQWIVKAHYGIRLRPVQKPVQNSQQPSIFSSLFGGSKNKNKANPKQTNTNKKPIIKESHSIPNEPQKRNIFYVGQKMQAYDDKHWYDAIIKEVTPHAVKIGWLNDKWASERWDKWFIEQEWDQKLRDPNSSSSAPAGRKQQQSKSGHVYKHIDEWSTEDLQRWIHTVGLGKNSEKKVVESIIDQEVAGSDFNSITEASEIMDAFEINQAAATKILNALNATRNNSKDSNVDESHDQMQSNTIQAQEPLQKDKIQNKDSGYADLEQRFSRLEEQNRELLETKDELTAISESLRFDKIEQEKKYNLLLEKYNKAINDISSLEQQNNDLNEECKEVKLELKDIKNKYKKWAAENSDYTTWDYDGITDWIIGLDKEYIEYENELRQQLKEEQIRGADLIDLDKNDLTRLGIKVFKHKKHIMQEIKKLAAK